MASWENCERRGGSVNVAAEGANIIRREAKGYAGEGERGRGSVKAEGAGAEVFAGDGCSQGASFGPMALISRRGQGRRIYNNTRTREWLRRKCVKPADLTTHSPSKICSRPRTTTRPARAFSHSLPAHFRSPAPRRCTPADLTTHSPSKICSRPRAATRPARAFSHSLPAPTHTRRLRDAFLAEDLRSPTQRRCTPADLTTHSPPKTFARPRTLPLPHAAPTHTRKLRDARPPTSQHILRRKPAPAPAQRHALPEHFLTPSPPRRTPAGCAMHARRPHNTFPVEDLLPPPHSDAPCPSTFAPPRSADARPPTSQPIPRRRPSPVPAAPRCPPSVPLRAQKNGTAQCMCDAECFGRPSLRSVVWVGEPRAVRRRCGALACRRGA